MDLTNRTVRIEPADPSTCRLYLGGRGLQARLIHEHLRRVGPIRDPLGPDNRLILGTGVLNDTLVPTAGRGSCSFVSPLTRSPRAVSWVTGHAPLHGLPTHSSAGGRFPNMLARAGIDQLIVDGRADRPVRLLAADGQVTILDAEDDLFQVVGGRRLPRDASAITSRLTELHPGSATVSIGPAGYRMVAYACLTGDHHRNFGRGGAGAIFGSKNLIAVTACGRSLPAAFDPGSFSRLVREVDAGVASRVADGTATASFRPTAGTTWWLDRAFDGGYGGKKGGYLPWHNYDEGAFDPAGYARAGTAAFLEIAGRHHVCSRCRHIMCTREATVASGPWAGSGVRPEFETIALWINCCITDRDAIFYLNALANRLGLDTMTAAAVIAAAMDLAEHGHAREPGTPSFGNAGQAVAALEQIACGTSSLGESLAGYGDLIVEAFAGSATEAREVAAHVTTAFGGLGYAGIEPKVFPGMFLAYATSSRGRGDHTSAWTIQAEESGLSSPGDLAGYVADAQEAKSLIDSLGLCDFFTEDVTSEAFVRLIRALTGVEYVPDDIEAAARRIVNVERLAASIQGRSRTYDLYVPPKLTVPLTAGAHAGKAVDPAAHERLLDAYYARQGWTREGHVPAGRLRELGIES